MNYVYILYSQKDKQFYVGCTSDLQKRVKKHNAGQVPSTKDRVPLDLIYYEAFTNQTDAYTREQWLKSGYGKIHMIKMLANTIKSLGG